MDAQHHPSSGHPILGDSGGRPRHGQLADPAVSEMKFDWEVTHFRECESGHRGRGILLIRADFPVVLLAFAAPHVRPIAVLFGARLDYTDYDLSPPSLCLVDPFSERAYEPHELPQQLLRRTVTIGHPSGGASQFEVRPLVHSPNGSPPIICMPGTRDYYAQPRIGRDAWLLHRHEDAGSLSSLIEQLYSCGLAASDPFPVRELAGATSSESDHTSFEQISRLGSSPTQP